MAYSPPTYSSTHSSNLLSTTMFSWLWIGNLLLSHSKRLPSSSAHGIRADPLSHLSAIIHTPEPTKGPTHLPPVRMTHPGTFCHFPSKIPLRGVIAEVIDR